MSDNGGFTHRFAHGQFDLSSNEVEELRRRGALTDLPVALVQLLHLHVVAAREAILVVVTRLQKPLNACARVLRSHA